MLYSFFMPAAKMKDRLATKYVTFGLLAELFGLDVSHNNFHTRGSNILMQ